MPIRREVKMGGARFGKPAGTPPKTLTPREQEDALVNTLRILLRRMARRLGVPPEEINTKVTRLLKRLRAEVRSELST